MIIDKFRKFFQKGSFRTNVATLFSGSLVSQMLYLLLYPFITRIYSTADFGRYAIFVSFYSILSVLATGQYELSLLLPKKKESLINLTYGSVLISIFMSILITIGLILGLPLLKKYNYFDSYEIVLFLGFSVFVFAVYQILFYLSLRKKDFKRLSIINIISVGSSILFQWLLSRTFLKEYGLILGFMGGTIISTMILFRENNYIFSFRKKLKILFPNIKKQIVRFKEFPLFNLPATFVNLSANQMPQIILNGLGSSVVGQFALSQRVLGSPVTLLSTSISYVFKERASSDYRTIGNCREIFVQTFKNLFLISIVPFVLLYLFAPFLVPIVFGAEWKTAGEYIRALTPMFFFKFTVSPLTYVILIAEKQKLNLILMILLFLCTSLSIWIGVRNGDAMAAVTTYSIVYSIIYVIYFLISYKLSGNDK